MLSLTQEGHSHLLSSALAWWAGTTLGADSSGVPWSLDRFPTPAAPAGGEVRAAGTMM